jgi:hypothetical protein
MKEKGSRINRFKKKFSVFKFKFIKKKKKAAADCQFFRLSDDHHQPGLPSTPALATRVLVPSSTTHFTYNA